MPTLKKKLALLFLLLNFGIMVSTIVQESATIDEQSHLFRGVAYLQTGATQFLLGHPIGNSALAAILPVLTEPNLQLPIDTPAWNTGNWSISGDQFLWHLNAHPQRILFLGRMTTIWITVVLVALLFRWGCELEKITRRQNIALFAMGIAALDPNLLAHGRFIMGDVPMAFAFTFTFYGLWRYSVAQTRVNTILIGIGFGLACVVKFNAVLLIPIIGVSMAGIAWQQKKIRPMLDGIWIALIGWLVIWIVYRGAIRPLPGGAFWNDFQWVLSYFNRTSGGYLFGRYNPNGWWYYFPVVFLLKTPLPTLVMLAIALIGSLLHRPKMTIHSWFLIFPVIFYFASALTTSLNIGYRHLLPILPILLLFISYQSGFFLRKYRFLALVLLAGVTLWNYPHYVPFFNLIAGGHANGWKVLSDSNVDWGQDLPALSAWQQQHPDQPLYLSYFGTAAPSAYGIHYQPIPAWPPTPEQLPANRQGFNPSSPAPGIYAISVSHLHGYVLGEKADLYAYFRTKTPFARLGYSIFLYEVAPTGNPVDVAFADSTPQELSADLLRFFPSNDWKIRWFNPDQVVMLNSWVVTKKNRPIPPEFAPYWQTPVVSDTNHAIYHTSPLTIPTTSIIFSDTLSFLGSTRIDSDNPTEITLLTRWQVIAPTKRPLKLFIHAVTDSTDQPLSQWDGLEIDSTSWQKGDVFIHSHRFSNPTDLLHGQPLSFHVGVYDAATGSRLLTPEGDDFVIPYPSR